MRTKKEIEIKDDFCILKFTNMKKEIKEILFSHEDLPLIEKYNWYIHEPGYAKTKINGKMEFFHRVIMGCPKEFEVDHIDRNPSNNQRTNLRIVNSQQNKMNKSSKGISFREKHNRWRAYIKINGKMYEKTFLTKKEAINYRKFLREQHFGEFA